MHQQFVVKELVMNVSFRDFQYTKMNWNQIWGKDIKKQIMSHLNCNKKNIFKGFEAEEK